MTQRNNPLSVIADGLLASDMARLEEELKAGLKPQVGYLSDVEYNLYKHGKKLRPMMMLLSAHMICGSGPAPQRAVKGAASLEMLHVASLIHDDIIDGAGLRRGYASVNAARGTGTAIVMGDMQFLCAIRGFIDSIKPEGDMPLVSMVLDSALDVCRGELDELRAGDTWDMAELTRRYFETVDRKTASLFGLACEAGVILADGDMDQARQCGFFGRRLGRAFQIMDDLFDFIHEEKESGKAKGADLANRRLSLPILYALEELGEDHIVTRIVKHGDSFTSAELAAAIDGVKCSAAFTRAYAKARAFCLEALDYLRRFEASPYRDALEEIAMYMVNRL